MVLLFLFIKENTAYEVRIRYWGSDVSSSDLRSVAHRQDSKTFNGWFAGAARLANENRRVAVADQSAVRAASTRRNGSYRLGAIFTSPNMTSRVIGSARKSCGKQRLTVPALSSRPR